YHTAGAYKLYNPTTKKVIASKDVTINEKDHWNWDTQAESSQASLPFTFNDENDDENMVETSPPPTVQNEPE
ncbi:hypothetical protein A2U01_0086002, partial [Trifolium medium]|nr:hypothetical protein [Trifolium medium]